MLEGELAMEAEHEDFVLSEGEKDWSCSRQSASGENRSAEATRFCFPVSLQAMESCGAVALV